MRRFSELNTLCRKNNLEPIGNIMARYYDDYQQYDPDCADIEVSIQIDLNHEIGGVVRKEPGYLCVSALHYGPYRDEYKTYTLMMEWMKKNNLVMCGPALEYYLIDPIFTNDEKFIINTSLGNKKAKLEVTTSDEATVKALLAGFKVVETEISKEIGSFLGTASSNYNY